ncbi:UDP-N-acetylmuramoyl-L-alanine--D-glutamate ligase [Sphingomonas sp. DG1-23]|uniref:UDP-N-acetylmuramoyl-L-alanine--D-glutamate ligase n=1 Tax=Sphingomonas sp. DG1-23 TaxID=3068316 RepID=UPI00273E90FD|nr:UDP-N-acetylmuramoyl-L-alanine--D-glutamate ligase [Sphingomonas sp. DG1-23]MDP5279567.1 UDP-N-acetylmuramoyl-L-alanine--D-glutamate ligase [Sphingomonas sp. DG1-23]
MITSTAWRGKRYAVLGLARSGAATVRALVASGASVLGWDDNEATQRSVWEQLKADRQELGTEPGFTTKDWVSFPIDLSGFDAVVVSPGVPLNRHPVAEKAAKYGVPVIGDIELFAQARADLPPHKVVGITGTNGKSTTTALIDHIARTAGLPSLAGGNIGLPILGRDPLPEGGVYVLELSSYQIDLTFSLDCDVAVLLNITPDHLDRYDGFEGYAASKARLFAMQSKGHAAVIGIGDAPSAEIARQVAVSGRSEDITRIAPGVCMDQSRWPALQGPHNAQNALAAIATCEALGIDKAAIDKGLETFPGLPHRMERVAMKNEVLFVNDSKATNADSTTPALSAYPRVHWILGGRAKTDSLEACRPGFGHVVKAYTIGEAGELFASLLEGEMPVERSGSLAAAVKSAAANAKAGETVLLSPACASFDQFKDYEARGQAFRDAVEALG